jgi:hypothetical protein
MFIPKEIMAEQHARLKQGTTVGFHGQNLVVTQRGLISVAELNQHPYGNYYSNPNATYGKSGSST